MGNKQGKVSEAELLSAPGLQDASRCGYHTTKSHVLRGAPSCLAFDFGNAAFVGNDGILHLIGANDNSHTFNLLDGLRYAAQPLKLSLPVLSCHFVSAQELCIVTAKEVCLFTSFDRDVSFVYSLMGEDEITCSYRSRSEKQCLLYLGTSSGALLKFNATERSCRGSGYALFGPSSALISGVTDSPANSSNETPTIFIAYGASRLVAYNLETHQTLCTFPFTAPSSIEAKSADDAAVGESGANQQPEQIGLPGSIVSIACNPTGTLVCGATRSGYLIFWRYDADKNTAVVLHVLCMSSTLPELNITSVTDVLTQLPSADVLPVTQLVWRDDGLYVNGGIHKTKEANVVRRILVKAMDDNTLTTEITLTVTSSVEMKKQLTAMSPRSSLFVVSGEDTLVHFAENGALHMSSLSDKYPSTTLTSWLTGHVPSCVRFWSGGELGVAATDVLISRMISRLENHHMSHVDTHAEQQAAMSDLSSTWNNAKNNHHSNDDITMMSVDDYHDEEEKDSLSDPQLFARCDASRLSSLLLVARGLHVSIYAEKVTYTVNTASKHDEKKHTTSHRLPTVQGPKLVATLNLHDLLTAANKFSHERRNSSGEVIRDGRKPLDTNGRITHVQLTFRRVSLSHVEKKSRGDDDDDGNEEAAEVLLLLGTDIGQVLLMSMALTNDDNNSAMNPLTAPYPFELVKVINVHVPLASLTMSLGEVWCHVTNTTSNVKEIVRGLVFAVADYNGNLQIRLAHNGQFVMAKKILPEGIYATAAVFSDTCLPLGLDEKPQVKESDVEYLATPPAQHTLVYFGLSDGNVIAFSLFSKAKVASIEAASAQSGGKKHQINTSETTRIPMIAVVRKDGAPLSESVIVSPKEELLLVCTGTTLRVLTSARHPGPLNSVSTTNLTNAGSIVAARVVELPELESVEVKATAVSDTRSEVEILQEAAGQLTVAQMQSQTQLERKLSSRGRKSLSVPQPQIVSPPKKKPLYALMIVTSLGITAVYNIVTLRRIYASNFAPKVDIAPSPDAKKRARAQSHTLKKSHSSSKSNRSALPTKAPVSKSQKGRRSSISRSLGPLSGGNVALALNGRWLFTNTKTDVLTEAAVFTSAHYTPAPLVKPLAARRPLTTSLTLTEARADFRDMHGLLNPNADTAKSESKSKSEADSEPWW